MHISHAFVCAIITDDSASKGENDKRNQSFSLHHPVRRPLVIPILTGPIHYIIVHGRSLLRPRVVDIWWSNTAPSVRTPANTSGRDARGEIMSACSATLARVPDGIRFSVKRSCDRRTIMFNLWKPRSEPASAIVSYRQIIRVQSIICRV